jgi:predicted DsbA family dithiol-disulfide isomerase
VTAPPAVTSVVDRDWWPVTAPRPATATGPVLAALQGEPAPVSPPPVVVYGDFTCPYSFLASQRVDALTAAGLAAVQWRAVEHDRSVAPSGRLGQAEPGWRRAVTEVAALARPGERVPAQPPVVVSNTHAAVYLYAWAGVSDRPLVRRRLFEAVWINGLPVGSVEDLLALLGREAVHPALSGSAGLRLGLWRAQWQQVSGRRLPAVVRPADGVVVTGADALAYLAGLLTGAAANPTSPNVSPS